MQLLLEPVGGCAGDMTLAALFDLGVPVQAVTSGLDRLGLEGWSLCIEGAEKCGIWGTRVEVRIDAERHRRERSWSEIRRLIADAGLPKRARELSLSIFERIALSEAHVHATTVDHVHFHEVGAVDSIVDIVGVALALCELDAEAVFSRPPPLGTGIVSSRHGRIPVPAPATLEILRGREVLTGGPGERTTPTGAAILAAATRPMHGRSFVPERVGYGVGHADFDDAANLLRAVLFSEAAGEEELVELTCNLDDASPQLLSHALERVLAAGAVDAWIAPVIMKKGRPAHLLGALVPARLRSAVAAELFAQTPTLGLRWQKVEREILERRFDRVSTRFGEISVKVGLRGDRILNAQPEWDECVRAAEAHGVPPRLVREEVLAAWMAARRA